MVVTLVTTNTETNMTHLQIIWDEESEDGNAAHIADNFQTFEDVENVFCSPFEKTFSRSSGLPL